MIEAGKGLARLAQAEQLLDRGSVLSRLGAGLQLRRCGSSLGPFQYTPGPAAVDVARTHAEKGRDAGRLR